MAEYKDPFTLDGRIRPQVGVTPEKVEFMARLVEDTLSGDRRAKGILEESITTSDAIFNFAHLTNMTVLQNFPDIPREWQGLSSGNLPVSDFKPAALYQIAPDWADTSAVLGANVVSPRVPEGAIYPYAYFVPEQASMGEGIFKYGFKTGFTFEAFINDSIGFLAQLPQTMLQIALDTEEYIFFSKLRAALTAANDLAGGVNVEGTTVAANAPLSRASVIKAIEELGARVINGRQVVLTGGFKLIVPAGKKAAAEFALLPVLTGLENSGTPTALYTITGYNPLSDITIVESVHFTGTEWAIIPNGNSANRPIIQSLSLVGHETPELRVQGNTGTYVGGASVSPFEGNFENDTADFRIRQFFNAVVWTPELIIWSEGDGN